MARRLTTSTPLTLALAPMALILALSPAPARSDAVNIEIRSIEPARTDSALVCFIETDGLPDERSLETLRSGLPTSVVLDVIVQSENGKDRGRSRTEVRIEPDLWKQKFVIRAPFTHVRVDSIPGLGEAMSRLGPVTIFPLDGLLPDPNYRLRVRVAVHSLAPSEVQKVTEIFAGEESGKAQRREVSVGIGSIIRFFMGRDDDEDWVAEGFSSLFGIDELSEPTGAQGGGEPQ